VKLSAAGPVTLSAVDLVNHVGPASSVTDVRSSAVRRVGAAVFHAMARQIVPDSTDTQCGFKFFSSPLTRASAGRLLEGSAPRWVYRRHAWVAVSPSTVAAMRERLGWTGDIYLIPNGTARPVTATVARAGAKNLVWVGRLVAPKRAGLLVGVAERLRQRPPQERPFLDVLAEGPVLDQLVAAGPPCAGRPRRWRG